MLCSTAACMHTHLTLHHVCTRHDMLHSRTHTHAPATCTGCWGGRDSCRVTGEAGTGIPAAPMSPVLPTMPVLPTWKLGA